MNAYNQSSLKFTSIMGLKKYKKNKKKEVSAFERQNCHEICMLSLWKIQGNPQIKNQY